MTRIKIGAKLQNDLDIYKYFLNFAPNFRVNLFKLLNMEFKRFFKDTQLGFIIKNIALAAVLLMVVLIGVNIGIKIYTEHGVEVEVPDVRGYYMEEARIMMESEGLRVELIDSTYSTKTPLGTIVEQNPLPGGHVKRGRAVYVIQNARFRKPVIMPEIRDMSLRQATAALKVINIHVSDIRYEPSTYRNLVLDVRQGDQSIEAGSRLTEGCYVDLIVGMGKGVGEVTVPDLSGKTLTEARSWLLSVLLTLGLTEYDIPPTEDNKANYVVYHQSPAAGEVLQEGSEVNIKLTTDIERVVQEDNEHNEEDFF